jgi:hypothetical protein
MKNYQESQCRDLDRNRAFPKYKYGLPLHRPVRCKFVRNIICSCPSIFSELYSRLLLQEKLPCFFSFSYLFRILLFLKNSLHCMPKEERGSIYLNVLNNNKY